MDTKDKTDSFPNIYTRLFLDLMLMGLHQIKIADSMEEIHSLTDALIKLALEYKRYFSVPRTFGSPPVKKS